MARLARILDRADDLGMVAIIGYFYFGQDQRLADEAAVIRATDEGTKWLLAGGWRNVLVEVNNECNVSAYDHAILKPNRVHELIERVCKTQRDGRGLLTGTSYGGGAIPRENVVRVSDFLLLHGNGVKEPARIREMMRRHARRPATARCRFFSTRTTTSISSSRRTTSPPPSASARRGLLRFSDERRRL